MPAVTRSQSKKEAQVVQQLIQAKKKIIRLIKSGKQETQVNSRSSNKDKFVKVIKDKLSESDYHRNMAYKYKYCVTQLPEGPAKVSVTKKHKQYYYDNVRIVTEMYYLIVDWFDKVFVVNGTIASPSFQRLVNVIFNKVAEFECDIKNAPPNPTPEEKHIIKTFLDQLQETRKVITPYVSSQEKATEVKVAAPQVAAPQVAAPQVAAPQVAAPQVAAVPQVKPRRSARLMALKKN
jgi:hypothetical protein